MSISSSLARRPGRGAPARALLECLVCAIALRCAARAVGTGVVFGRCVRTGSVEERARRGSLHAPLSPGGQG